MRIWIDNDGCPRMVRDLIFKVSERRKIPVSVVANSHMHLPVSTRITMFVVPGTFDAADNYIAEHVEAGDLVITSDIPLASRIVAKGALGLSTRGDVFNKDNVQERLADRNLLQELRSAGDVTGGPPPLNERDKKRFADALDRIVSAVHLAAPES